MMTLLAMTGMGWQQWALLGLAAVAGYFTVTFFYGERRKMVPEQQTLLDGAGLFQQLGWPHAAGVLQHVAMLDIPGAVQEARTVNNIAKDPALKAAALRTLTENALTMAWKDPAERPRLVALFNSLQGSRDVADAGPLPVYGQTQSPVNLTVHNNSGGAMSGTGSS